MMCNGMLAGLVAITAPCAFVRSRGRRSYWRRSPAFLSCSAFSSSRRVGVDDPVGAISVHGVNGLWGVLSVGIFATGEYGAGWNGVVREEMVKLYGSDGVRGLLYGDFSQFIMQVIDARCCRRLRLRYGLRLVQSKRSHHADSRQQRDRDRRARWSGDGHARLSGFPTAPVRNRT